MALNNTDKREIEALVRREIKNFLEINTIKQLEDKLMDRVYRELRRGKVEGEIKEITLRMFKEFYHLMWTNRSFWEPKLKNA